MNNQFDSDNYPDAEPRSVVAGERWAWTRSDITEAYPTATYTLEYRLAQQDSSHSDITFQAGKESSAHVVEVAAATTTGYDTGDHVWQAVVIRDSDSEEIVVSSGFIKVNIGANSGDVRTWERKTLDAIRAVLENTASKEDEEYSIAGRSLKRRSIEDLLMMEKEFSARVKAQEEEVNMENGRSTGRKRVYLKMGA